MARPLRINYPGAFYHVTSRGNERRAIFKSTRDREKFLDYLESAVLRYEAIIHTYCLMDNHYHLLLETPAGNLSQIMRHINGAYTTYFNIKRKRVGHLFQGRYKSILVDKNEYAQELSRYIHLNPVRARMVELPEDYKWSSYSYFTGKKRPPAWLQRGFVLRYFGNKVSSAEKGYKNFAECLLNQKYGSPLDCVVSSTLLGTPDFIKLIQEKYLSGVKPDKDVPATKELSKKASIEEIFAETDAVFIEDVRARNVKMYLGQKYSGESLQKIAGHFGISESGVSHVSRRVAERMQAEKKLRRKVERVVSNLELSIFKT